MDILKRSKYINQKENPTNEFNPPPHFLKIFSYIYVYTWNILESFSQTVLKNIFTHFFLIFLVILKKICFGYRLSSFPSISKILITIHPGGSSQPIYLPLNVSWPFLLLNLYQKNTHCSVFPEFLEIPSLKFHCTIKNVKYLKHNKKEDALKMKEEKNDPRKIECSCGSLKKK